MKNRFKVYFINFDYSRYFDTLEEAVADAKASTWDYTITDMFELNKSTALISAAPELYASLEQLLKALEKIEGRAVSMPEVNGIMWQGFHILSKARGES